MLGFDAAVAAFLLKGTTSDDTGELFEVLYRLVQAAPAATEPDVLSLCNAASEARRALGAQLLQALPADVAVASLIEAMHDPHPYVRFYAASTLVTFRDDERIVAPLVWAITFDVAVDVRNAAATTLGQVRGSPARRLLVKMAKEASPELRETAQVALQLLRLRNRARRPDDPFAGS